MFATPRVIANMPPPMPATNAANPAVKSFIGTTLMPMDLEATVLERIAVSPSGSNG
jgi:hypothetical protein